MSQLRPRKDAPRAAWHFQISILSAAGTLNQLCEEMAAEGDEGQYLHITVQHQLEPPTMDVLRSLKNGDRWQLQECSRILTVIKIFIALLPV